MDTPLNKINLQTLNDMSILEYLDRPHPYWLDEHGKIPGPSRPDVQMPYGCKASVKRGPQSLQGMPLRCQPRQRDSMNACQAASPAVF